MELLVTRAERWVPMFKGWGVTFLDRLAEIEHKQWMQWASKLMETEAALSPERLARWKRLMVPFDQLSEEWKEYDREWARHVLREVRLQIDEEHVAYFGGAQ